MRAGDTSANARSRTMTMRNGTLLAAGLTALLLATACAPAQQYQGYNCGERRLDLAAGYFDQAREKLAQHYRLRSDSTLSEAMHASQDSILLARATRVCDDFDEVLRRQAIDLIKTNILFQRLVVSNMRDQDPGVVVDLYGSQYREIFKNDIR
jgi:hypothetical protein